MFCIHCGKQIADGSAFCSYCGGSVSGAVLSSPQEAPAEAFRPAEDLPAKPEAAVEEAVPVTFEDATPLISETEDSDAQAERVPEAVEASAPEEVSFSAAPVYEPAAEDAPYAEPLSPEKPEKKSFPIFIIAAAVAAFAILVDGIVWAVAANSPAARLMKAAQKSGTELEELFGNSDTFVTLLENAAALSKKGELTAKINYETDQSYGWDSLSQSYSVLLSRSEKDKELYVDFAMESAYSFLGTPYYGSTESNEDFRVLAYANSKQLVAAMPDVLDDAYYLPLHKLGEKLPDSDLYGLLEDELDEEVTDAIDCLDVNLFADTGWSAFKKACPGEVKGFTDSLVIEKTDREIPHGDDGMKVYSIECDMSALVDMAVAYQLFTMDAVYGEGIADAMDSIEDDLRDELEYYEDYDIVLYAGISKGCLTALHAEIDDGYYDSSFTLLLEGRENIWEDCTVYLDEEKILSGGIEMTKDGFKIALENEYDEEILIICDDDAGSLKLRYDGEELFAVRYGAEDRGCQLSYEQEDSYGTASLNVELLPLEEIQKIEDPISLLELDRDDLYDILFEIADRLDLF